MKHNRRIKIIYGDGTSESYYTTANYDEVMEQARAKARARGTIVRSFAFLNS